MLGYRHFFKHHRVLRSQRLVHRLDLGEVYPCPLCRHRSTIQSLTLTEAFGCDRCQQIYVICEEGRGLEQISGAHPYRRLWRWTGSQWKQYSKIPASGWLVLLVTMAVILLVLGLWLLLPISFKVMSLVAIGLAAWAIMSSNH